MTLSPRLSSVLNFWRWFAAWVVVACHLRQIFLPPVIDYSGLRLLLLPIVTISEFGHEAVMVFFVISGFLVGGLTLNSANKRGFSLSDYAVKRFSRIYIVLVPALLLTLSSDMIGARYWNGSGIYDGGQGFRIGSMDWSAVSQLDLPTFLANLFMLQRVTAPSFGSNGPLWSLSYEWWYYMLFATVALFFFNQRRVVRALCVVAALSMIAILPLPILAWGAFWAVGLAVYEYLRRGWWRPPVWVGIGVFAAAVTLNFVSRGVDFPAASYIRDGMIAGGFAVMLVSFDGERPIPFANLNHHLAEFSFSLYLVHFPLIVLAAAIAHDAFNYPLASRDGWPSFALSGALMIAVIAIAYAVSRLTEARTGQLRDFLNGVIQRARAHAIAAASPPP